MENIRIRAAQAEDSALILSLIRELAEFEKLEHEVVATEAQIRETLFGSDAVPQVLIAEFSGQPAGFALFFPNFSTLLVIATDSILKALVESTA